VALCAESLGRLWKWNPFMSIIYGPVPSRRLGRSLGVDLVPMKTCSYDCIYCQLGRTTCKTVERKPWVPAEKILPELAEKLSTRPDYVTLSGSGEPTLNSELGEIARRIKDMTDIPVSVLTNGSLLWQPDVRRDVGEADLVVPSLDAGDEAMFQAVNRPHPNIGFEKMVDGLVALREEFSGPIWLEVFLLAGHTAVQADAEKLAEQANRVRADRIQLNTVTRPPVEEYAAGVSPERMEELAELFRPRAEVIADFSAVQRDAPFRSGVREVLALLQRRPCTLEDIAGGLAMHLNEAVKYVQQLEADGRIARSVSAGKTYYRPA
jgi:wyosine [tRNA(Phe)-imidazoG37] synthetase (radical SAM superfamily)